MPVDDTVLTRYILEDGYSGPASKVVGATNAISNAHARAKAHHVSSKKALDDLSKSADYLKDAYSELTGAATKGFAAAAVVVGAYAVAANDAMHRAAEWDALVAALVAVEGSADKAQQALLKVREAAKAPGLGQREAIAGFSKLRRSGLDDDFALRTLKEFGNANATGGGGKAELDRLLTAVSQIASKPFLQGDELLQLTEGGIPAYKLIKDIFGTSDTEEMKKKGIDATRVLQALVAELAKMTRVAGGAKNSFENLEDAFDFAMVTMGQSLNKNLLPLADKAADSIAKGSEAGLFEDLGQTISDAIVEALGTNDTDDLLVEAVVALRTMAFGMAQLADNVKGLLDLMDKAKYINPYYWYLELSKKAMGVGDTPNLGDMHAKFKNEEEMRMELYEKRKKRREELDSKNEKKDPTKDLLVDPATQTAKNTAELVQIEKRRMDIQRAVLGGGALAPLGMNPSAIGRASRKQINSRGFQMIMDGVFALSIDLATMAQQYELDSVRAGR